MITEWRVTFKDSVQKMRLQCTRDKKHNVSIVTEYGDSFSGNCSIMQAVGKFYGTKVEKLQYLGGAEVE